MNGQALVAAAIVVAVVVGLLAWGYAHEMAEREYVRTHACRVVEHRPGYFTTSVSTDGKGRTSVGQIWHGPRERWSCVDGTQHWTDAL